MWNLYVRNYFLKAGTIFASGGGGGGRAKSTRSHAAEKENQPSNGADNQCAAESM